MSYILIADDNPDITSILSLYAEKEGFEPVVASDGEEAIHLFNKYNPVVVLLDVMMPKEDGYEVCRKIRAKSDVPVILVTARGEDFEKIMGLDIGADDYIVKPFSMMEMVSRVKAVLRRCKPKHEDILKIGELVVNLKEHTVTIENSRISLTYKEFELLRLFLSHQGMVYTREQLFSQVWNMDYMGDSRTLDSHIRSLRHKLGTYGNLIETIRNVGYRWEGAYDQ